MDGDLDAAVLAAQQATSHDGDNTLAQECIMLRGKSNNCPRIKPVRVCPGNVFARAASRELNMQRETRAG